MSHVKLELNGTLEFVLMLVEIGLKLVELKNYILDPNTTFFNQTLASLSTNNVLYLELRTDGI